MTVRAGFRMAVPLRGLLLLPAFRKLIDPRSDPLTGLQKTPTSLEKTSGFRKPAGCEKRGDTLVKTLRKTYGPDFAAGVRGDARLDTLRERSGSESLSQLLKESRRGGKQ